LFSRYYFYSAPIFIITYILYAESFTVFRYSDCCRGFNIRVVLPPPRHRVYVYYNMYVCSIIIAANVTREDSSIIIIIRDLIARAARREEIRETDRKNKSILVLHTHYTRIPPSSYSVSYIIQVSIPLYIETKRKKTGDVSMIIYILRWCAHDKIHTHTHRPDVKRTKTKKNTVNKRVMHHYAVRGVCVCASCCRYYHHMYCCTRTPTVYVFWPFIPHDITLVRVLGGPVKSVLIR